MTIYAGLDVSNRTTHVCVVDADGVVPISFKAVTEPLRTTDTSAIPCEESLSGCATVAPPCAAAIAGLKVSKTADSAGPHRPRLTRIQAARLRPSSAVQAAIWSFTASFSFFNRATKNGAG